MDTPKTLKGLTTITILDDTTPDPVTLATFANLKNGEFKPGAEFNTWEEDHADDGGEGGVGGLRATGEFTWDEVDLTVLDNIMSNTVATIKAEFTSKGQILTTTIAAGDIVTAGVADGKAKITFKCFRPAGSTLADVWTKAAAS